MNQRIYTIIGTLAAMTGLLAGCSKDKTTPPPAPTQVIVKTLKSPANAASFNLETTDKVIFEWAAAAAVSRAGNIKYEILFDYENGDFSEPVYTLQSDDSGSATKATISKNVLIDIAREWGADAGATATLKWSVNTIQSDKALLSEQSRTIALIRPMPEEPAGPPVVTELISPEDMQEVDLSSIRKLAFKWKEAASDGENAVHYTILFDVENGDFSEPIDSVKSASSGLDAQVEITADRLDEIAGLAGIEPDSEGTLLWTILSSVGDEEYVSEEVRGIALTRLPLEPAKVTNLKKPADGEEINLSEIETLAFEWGEAEWSGEGDVTYELVLDKGIGNFSLPIKTITSSNNGLDASVILTKEELDEIAAEAGAITGGTVTIKWKVRAKSGDNLVLSEKYKSFKLTRQSKFTVGDALYIGGAGTEAGQQFRFVEEGDTKHYEIYTKIKGNMPYYFYSGENESDENGAKFVVTAAGNEFEEIESTSAESAKLGETGIYRIKLNFETKAVTFETVEKVAIRYAINNRDVSLSYIGKGTWKTENYNVLIRRESWGVEVRYRFLFKVDGAEEFWGKLGSTPSATDGDRAMQKVGKDMWSGVWDYPSALRDNNNFSRYYTDVVLNMNTVNDSYTHNFENWKDSETYYGGDRNIPDMPVWEAAADSINFTLVDQFMNKSKGTFWASAKNILNNSNVLYWQQAYPMHTLLYQYERIKDSNPSLAAEYRNYFSLWISNNGNNWYGTKKNGFYNEYTDDMAWMALVFIHMYEVFGTDSYLTKAKEIYGYMTESKRIIEDAKGWGLIWKLNSTSRNACTNTPAIVVAAKLYQITGTQNYLDEAVKLYDFWANNSSAVKEGKVEEPPLTYTQGTWTEGCRLLYQITGDSKYMDNATLCMKYTMTSGRCINGAGLLRDEGSSGDQSNFKGGLIPYMVNYANDESMPVETRQQVKTFLIYNARLLWFHNMDKTLYPKTFANYSWNSVYHADGNPGSLGAHNSGAALMEGITRLK